MDKKIYFILILTCFQLKTLAQNTIVQIDNDRYFREGLDLFDKQQYAAARTAFEEYTNHDPESIKAIDAKYYIAFCAMSLYHNDGEFLLDQFVTQYEGHPKSVFAFYELGNFYFKNKDYDKAIAYLEKTDINKLTDDKRLETRFKLGYSHFNKKNFSKALSYFNNVKKGNSPYTAAANYYAGFLEFRNGAYDEALVDLKKAEKDQAYAAIVPYMILNVYYKQERYDELLRYGEQVVASGRKVKNLEDFSLLIAESYFRKQQYNKAASFFQTYIESQSAKKDPEVKYRLALSYYNLEDFDRAEQYFKEIASQKNAIGQSASYYLGNLYLRKNNKNFAITAYANAGKMNFDPVIQEEAIFKLAKINYDQGNFDQSIEALNNLATTFPNSTRSKEANILLSEAYLKTSDYDKAIEHLEKIGDKSARMKKAYQQVTYFKGTESFNNRKYRRAVQMFNKSLNYPEDQELVMKAHFWSGEAYSIGKRYEDAIRSYNNVIGSPFETNSNEYLRSRYGIGYAYYNSKRYDRALEHFDGFVNSPKSNINKQFYDDALIRLADCHYVGKNYDQALSNYQKAINTRNPDLAYAYFQKAVILGLMNNVPSARENFDIVINRYASSTYADNALYQKAQLDLEQGNYQTAANGFGKLISSKPQSSFVPHALLKRGFSNYNLKKYNQSKRDYKRILDDYPTHPTASSAISALQEVLAMQNQSSEFEPYLAKYKSANPDNKSLSNIEYETAKTLYNNQEYQKAIQSFERYMSSYPGSANAYEAKYYIGESYYRLKQNDQALSFYYQVENDNKTSRVNKSVQRIAEIEFSHANYDKAIVYFEKLAGIARNKRQSYNAWSGLMQSHFHLRNYPSVKEYANLILEKGNISADAANKATLYLGKAEYATGNLDGAMDQFMATLNAAKDENGAEAQFLLSKILYEQKSYQRSIETLIDLNTNFGVYENWIGESFLLIADNYVALQEYFQAEATLNSVIEKSPVEDVVQRANRKLRKLQDLKNRQQEPVEAVETDTTFQEIEN
ncbi:tetratricopeptide repeat protein [Fulvivirgaceae bacterium BMA12]|uniref:Tetratricopeptide repeat protein n=1 Tax=Agaribacillus aureus TaxID=3051825 RepID=A0ABT8L9B0_9BACT|nr:tetratricopeptide repeat protein [Fulvivirgaceae bacterium BMA12]